MIYDCFFSSYIFVFCIHKHWIHQVKAASSHPSLPQVGERRVQNRPLCSQGDQQRHWAHLWLQLPLLQHRRAGEAAASVFGWAVVTAASLISFAFRTLFTWCSFLTPYSKRASVAQRAAGASSEGRASVSTACLGRREELGGWVDLRRRGSPNTSSRKESVMSLLMSLQLYLDYRMHLSFNDISGQMKVNS